MHANMLVDFIEDLEQFLTRQPEHTLIEADVGIATLDPEMSFGAAQSVFELRVVAKMLESRFVMLDGVEPAAVSLQSFTESERGSDVAVTSDFFRSSCLGSTPHRREYARGQ